MIGLLVVLDLEKSFFNPEQIPLMYRTEPIEIHLDPKDLSSEMTVWKGAAVLAGLESARELWIRPEEWQKVGQKLLREKAPFPWT